MRFSCAILLPLLAVVLVPDPAEASFRDLKGFIRRLIARKFGVDILASPDNVLEIAVRRVKADVDLATFQEARANFINLLKQQDGIIEDAEFEAILTLDESFQLAVPQDRVFVGMTQYKDQATVERIQAALLESREAEAFFATFDMQCFQLVQAFDRPRLNLLGFPKPPQTIELAIRNVNDFSTFDDTRQEFIDFISGLPGVGRSGEYQSIIDDNIRVGTTFYRDEDAVRNVAAQQFTTPVTGDYYSLFSLPCYYILERID